jgi:hypothetical protein
MRSKHVLVCVLMVALAFGASAAFAAKGGDGNGTHGKSGETHGKPTASPDANHDPSNPDGTYRGKSGSTPDQDGIGADHGIDNNDKTGPGTDGNNGCGNDADREDDNNGWCGNKPEHVKPTPTETPSGSPAPTVSPTSTGSPAEVLGEQFTRPSVLGRALARTGVALIMFLVVAAVLGFFGLALRTIAKPKQR